MPNKVALSPNELYLAAIVGVRRQVSAMHLNFTQRNGADLARDSDAWWFHISGAMGELAAAKALGIYWPASINVPKDEPDLPPHWQVRTRSKGHYDLIVRPDDADDQRFILVTGSCPTFTVHGWILGTDAKQPRWSEDRGGRGAPCFWVPQRELVPFEGVSVNIPLMETA